MGVIAQKELSVLLLGRLRWAEHVAHVEEISGVGKYEGRNSVGGWGVGVYIRINLRDVDC
jgi:hypothetical protein